MAQPSEPSHPPLLARPRLSRLLDGAFQCKLTVVSAPAGFGKTTLVAAWVQALPPTAPRAAWVSLDSGANDPVRFLDAVLLALATVDAELTREAQGVLHTPGATPPLAYALTRLLNQIATRAESYLLILDDYHLVSEPSVHEALLFLLAYLPPQLSLIVLSRSEPPLPLADLRARGQLVELGVEQLRCTAEETAAFLQQVMGLTLAPGWLEELHRHSEGWLLGLQLLGLSLQGERDPANMLGALRTSAGPAIDFLTAQVFQLQPPEVRRFLRTTCILERLCGPLCDAVTGEPGSQAMLERIARANLFLVALDGQRRWYRYHQLFAEALRERLVEAQPGQIRALHTRASAWYAANGDTDAAIDHALGAEDWEHAAELIERLPVAFTWASGTREGARQQRWLQQLPESVLRARPRLCFIYARALYIDAPTERIEPWLKLAEGALRQTNVAGAHDDLLGEIASYRAYLDVMRGNGRRALVLCERALALLGPERHAARADVIYTLAITHIYRGHGATGAEGLVAAAELVARAGDRWSAVQWQSLAGAWQAFQGNLGLAWQILERAVRLAEEPYERALPTVGYALCFQADLLREWNRLDEALALAERAQAIPELAHSPLFRLLMQPVLARILWARGDRAGALAAVQRLDQVPAHWRRARAIYALGDQLRIWLAVDADERVEVAIQLIQAQRDPLALPHELELLARAEVLLARQRPTEARALLAPLLRSARRQRREQQLIAGLSLKALAHQQERRPAAALRALAQALRLAEREGYVRRFVDLGAPMRRLLLLLRARQPAQAPTAYLDRVLAAFGPETMVQ